MRVYKCGCVDWKHLVWLAIPYFLPPLFMGEKVGLAGNLNSAPCVDQSAYDYKFHTSERASTSN